MKFSFINIKGELLTKEQKQIYFKFKICRTKIKIKLNFIIMFDLKRIKMF